MKYILTRVAHKNQRISPSLHQIRKRKPHGWAWNCGFGSTAYCESYRFSFETMLFFDRKGHKEGTKDKKTDSTVQNRRRISFVFRKVWFQQRIGITAIWDSDAGVWVATSDDVPGPVTEADTSGQLVQKLKVLIPELPELNGMLSDFSCNTNSPLI